VFAVAAGAQAFWASRQMKRAGTNVNPDKPTIAIVTAGPYRYTRNPMYLSLCLLHLGIGLLINGVLPVLFTVPLALTLHFGVIKREERYLAAKFGEPYLAYQRRVRRWI
jgi:protein-S-isoprenylcysteine O-methyltransferase Ste14